MSMSIQEVNGAIWVYSGDVPMLPLSLEHSGPIVVTAQRLADQGRGPELDWYLSGVINGSTMALLEAQGVGRRQEEDLGGEPAIAQGLEGGG